VGRAGDAVQAFLKTRWFYRLVFAGCGWPLAVLVWNAAPVLLPAFLPNVVLPWDGDLGVNPVETLLHQTGRDALFFLIGTLAVTPLKRLTGWNRLQAVRRMVGVWSFVYAFCHFTVYAVFDKVGDVGAIAEDVAERTFILLGMVAFVILVLLTATSTNGMIRRLGRRWQRLHRLVYLAALAAAVHFVWGQKADIGEPLLWASVLVVLLGWRVATALGRRRTSVTT
jgi:methionine sulfoxide reductase heme-binding subunit